jgi:hypothetical protein
MRRRGRRPIGMRLAWIAFAMLPAIAHSNECSVRSGPKTAALVELYTSEGCSSCPPADRWLSAFTSVARNGDVVPLAFHVGYWDYIGWKDAYADARYTERQRERASASGARYVYTPQVVLGGRDFPAWSSERSLTAAFDAIRRKPAAVTLELSASVAADRTVSTRLTASSSATLASRNLALVTVVTQDGLGSQVTAGENRGEKLRHDFVVRDLAMHRGLGGMQSTFKPKADWNAQRMAVAAFAQDLATGEVLQAVSLPLCP